MRCRIKQLAPRPHALLVPYPTQGHITPLMELGRKLSTMGVTVTLVTFQKLVERIRSAKAAAAVLAAAVEGRTDGQVARDGEGRVRVRLAGVPDGLPPEAARDVWANKEFATAVSTRMEGEIVQLIRALGSSSSNVQDDAHDDDDGVAPPITCLVGDFFLSWMPRLAQRTNLPEVVFWPQNASVYAMSTLLDLIVSSHGYDPSQNYGTHEIPG